jgi:DNA-binding NtrC family response regulator
MAKRRSMTGELKRFFASARVPVYLLDTESRFVFGNATFSESFGVDATTLSGRACRYHSQPLDDPLDELATALAPPPEVQKGALQGELHLPSCESSFDVTWIPLPGPSGQQTLVIGIVGKVSFPELDPTFEQLQDLHTQLGAFREQMRRKYPLDFVIGTHPATQKLRDQLEVATAGEMNVTIVAPTFSDREKISRSIFYNRPPLHGRLLPLSCDLLDTELLESSLDSFQSSRADFFTGEDVPDTLLLLDIDQMSLECQILLERYLRGGGGWDYRVIATSSREFESFEFSPIIAAAFSTLTLRVAPLAERKEDISLLAQHFVERWNRTGKQRSGFARPAVEYLEAYNWPGDVDDLSEVVESACEVATAARIEVTDLPRKIHWWLEDLTNPRIEHATIELDELLQSIEMRLVKRALELSDGNKSQAARLLGITRMRVIRRVSEL